jgi:peptidylamidoglycolate lyase
MQKGMLLPSLLTTQQDAGDIKRNLLSLNSSFTYDPNWPTLPDNRRLGAVAAVCIDKNGNVAIFHRADRVWNADSFNIGTNVFAHQNLDPIAENTILLFDRNSGKLLKEWGGKHFYLPHGLYIDDDNNAWTTDTALHQVMKFNLNKSYDEPEMVLGKKFMPGKGRDALFCKPTSVAVLDNGDFFVADGYCNSRIVKFSKSGEIILQWGRNSFQGTAHPVAPPGFFAVPHALRLIKELNVLCVADRENGRIQCFSATNGTFHSQFHSSVIGSRLFSVDYAKNLMGKLDLYVLNGPEVTFNDPSVYHEIKGFVLDMENEKILSKFGPNGESFSNPHDIAVMHDGSELYVAELDPAKVYRFVASVAARMAPRNVTQPGKPITSTGSGILRFVVCLPVKTCLLQIHKTCRPLQRPSRAPQQYW